MEKKAEHIVDSRDRRLRGASEEIAKVMKRSKRRSKYMCKDVPAENLFGTR